MTYRNALVAGVVFPCMVGFLFCQSRSSGQKMAPAQSTAPRLGPVYGPPAVLGPVGPAVQVTLSRAVYHIRIDPKTGAPQMPTDVTAAARVVNWPEGMTPPVTFTWRVYLDWEYRSYPTHHDICNRAFMQSSPLRIDFGDQIRGGTLTVVARADINGQPVLGRASALVAGDNPPRALLLRAFPRSRYGLIASKIGMWESGLCQFTPAQGADPGGMPVTSPSSDVGMMQLNAPTGSITSADQVWDWRANVRQGMEILSGKQRTTLLAARAAASSERIPMAGLQQLAYLNLFRCAIGLKAAPQPAIAGMSERSGSGVAPGDVDLDHLRLSQYERDAIRRYNGGCEYTYSLTLDPKWPLVVGSCWAIDPARGGIDAKRGDPDYVRHVLIARSGMTLEEPHVSKPTRSHHARHLKRGRSKAAQHG